MYFYMLFLRVKYMLLKIDILSDFQYMNKYIKQNSKGDIRWEVEE